MGIYGYDRTYKTARFMLSLIEVIGWITVVVGCLLALGGLGTGGTARLFDSNPNIMVRLLAALPGLGMAVGGIFLIAWAQVNRATVDNTEISRETLEYLRKDRETAQKKGGAPDKDPEPRGDPEPQGDPPAPAAGKGAGNETSGERSADDTKTKPARPDNWPRFKTFADFDAEIDSSRPRNGDEHQKTDAEETVAEEVQPETAETDVTKPEAAKATGEPKRPVVVEKRVHRGYNIVVYDNGYAGVYTEADGWKVLVSMDELNKFIDRL